MPRLTARGRGLWATPRTDGRKASAAPVLVGEGCGDRDPQKTRDGRETQSRSRTEAEQEETGSKSDVGVGSGLSPGSASGQAHMEIPVASDGRVGSALRVAWCLCGLRPSMGSQALGTRRPCPLCPVLLRTSSTGVRAGNGVMPLYRPGSAASRSCRWQRSTSQSRGASSWG